MYPHPIYRPHPNPTEIPIQEGPINLSDFDPETNMDCEEYSPFQEGVI